jgi:hypothetical protein
MRHTVPIGTPTLRRGIRTTAMKAGRGIGAQRGRNILAEGRASVCLHVHGVEKCWHPWKSTARPHCGQWILSMMRDICRSG